MLEGLLTLGGLVMVCNFWVAARTQTAIYNDIRQVCPSKYGLVLVRSIGMAQPVGFLTKEWQQQLCFISTAKSSTWSLVVHMIGSITTSLWL